MLKGLRLLFQLVLVLIFLFFFGLPALKRYFAMEVMVVKTMRESGGKNGHGDTERSLGSAII